MSRTTEERQRLAMRPWLTVDLRLGRGVHLIWLATGLAVLSGDGAVFRLFAALHLVGLCALVHVNARRAQRMADYLGDAFANSATSTLASGDDVRYHVDAITLPPVEIAHLEVPTELASICRARRTK